MQPAVLRLECFDRRAPSPPPARFAQADLDAAHARGLAEGAAAADAAARRDLAASLFSIRARSVLGLAPDSDAASYASGLLIGAEVAAQMPSGAHVHLLANPPLSTLYATAIEVLGGSTTQVDSETAFLAGIRELQP